MESPHSLRARADRRPTRGTGCGPAGGAIRILLFLGASAGAIVAQQQVYRGGVDLVRIDAVVLDQARQPVVDLAASDFEILVDGVRREIVSFDAIDLPRADPPPVPARPAVPTGVVANMRPSDGRAIVVLMDWSIPAGAPTALAKAIATEVVDSMGPGDVGAVVRSGGFKNDGQWQSFTFDRARLRRAVESPFTGRTRPGGPGFTAYPTSGECICGTCTLHTLASVAEALEGETERQKMVFFVGSDVIVQQDDEKCSFPVRVARERALRAVDRANVAVHTIDPLALETLQANAESASPRSASVVADNLRRQGNLHVLPDFTGGRAILNTNEPQGHVPVLFDETSHYYLIGFERPTVDSSEAIERREIEVRVKRPGATVRHRRMYYPTGTDPATAQADDELGATITPLLPLSDLPLRLSATPLFQPDGSTAVGLALGFGVGVASDAPAATRGTDDDRVVDLIIGVFDQQAKPVTAVRQGLTIEVGSEATYEWHSFFPIPPGRYDVRVGVIDGEGDGRRRGSVYAHVEVPDPEDRRLSMSGLRLRSRPSAEQGGSGEGALLRRTFDRTENSIAVEAQLQRRRGDDSVDVVATIVDAAGTVASETAHTVTSFSNAGVAGISVPVHVSNLEPGMYILTIEATVDTDSERRDLRFEVK